MTKQDEYKKYWDRVYNIFKRLLAEKGIKKYIFVDMQHEGKKLPGDIENESGTILTQDSKLYGFWTDWDPNKINPETGEKGYYTLGDNKFLPDGTSFFAECTPEEYQKIQNDPEYLEAKKKLGIK